MTRFAQLICILVLLIFPQFISADSTDYATNRILVKFKPGITPSQPGSTTTRKASSIDQLSAQAKVTSYRPLSTSTSTRKASTATDQIYAVQLNDGQKISDVVKLFQNSSDVAVAEPDYHTQADFVPNDPSYPQQWAPTKLGLQSVWGLIADAPAPKPVTVAVLDTGIDFTHPDLQDITVTGYNFIDPTKSAQDDHGHGTHVAGIIGANTNNQIGIAGNAGYRQMVNIMPVKVLSASGGGYVSDLISGLYYARDHKARVISISLGTSQKSTLLSDAVASAVADDIIIVASAGNSGAGSNSPSYPAGNDGVFAIGSTDSSDHISSFSTHLPYVSFAAPGSGIYSTYPGGYATMSGTSMAAPQVTGVITAILAYKPDLSRSQVYDILKTTAIDLGDSGRDDYFGWGRINAYAAFELATGQKADPYLAIDFAGNKLDLGSTSPTRVRLGLSKNSNQQNLIPVELHDTSDRVIHKQIIFQKITSTKRNLDKSIGAPPYSLSANCQDNGSITASWGRAEDKRYSVVLYDCTDSSPQSECNTGVVVGSTESTTQDTQQSPTYIAEALPGGRTQKVTSGGNYPGPYGKVYNLFQATKDRVYALQLFSRNNDGSGYAPVDDSSTQLFTCSNGLDNFPTRHPTANPNPNPYSMEVACQTDGDQSGALWWAFKSELPRPDDSKFYKVVAYDCTYDKTADCSDDATNFIAASTSFSTVDQIQKSQPLTDKSGQIFITRPGHKYSVQLFAKNKSTYAIEVPNNASASITCR